MPLARSQYERSGYEVSDTSANRPYDLVVKRGSEIRRVEVKGTVGLGLRVLLTDGEVCAARVGPEPTDLFVVHTIDLVRDQAGVRATGGVANVVTNWNPLDRDLEPTQYRYAVPEGGS